MEYLPVLLGAIPSVLLWGTAVVIAAVRWSHHETVSALVIVGAMIQMMVSVAGTLVPVMAMRHGYAAAQMGIIAGINHLVGIGGASCIIAAVFVGRGPATRAPVDPKQL